MSVRHQAIQGLYAVVLLAVALPANAFRPVQLPQVVASITVTAAAHVVGVGHTDAFTAVARDRAGHVMPGVKFTWSSGSKHTASVSSTGVVSALASGTTVITARAQNAFGSVVLNVLGQLPTVTGVAAQGSALAGAAVTLVDSHGTTLHTTTGSDGSYSLDTTGLLPPFLIAVQADVSTTFYSVSADAAAASVINVDPLTDLIIRSWYSVQGTSVDAAFAHPIASPPPSPAEVQLISNVVVQVTALWLQQAGVNTATFNPISTPFVANNTGVDQVLDQTSIDTTTGAINITDGTTTQASTVSYDTGTTSMSVGTTTTGPGGTSSSVTGTVVASSSDTQTAVAGINTTLTAFTTAVNSGGANLTATELLPFLDTGLLDEGLNKTLFADSTADQFRGLTISFQILNINSLDTTNGLADVSFTASASQGDQTQTQIAEFFFKKQSNGSWLFFGDQLPAKLGVESEMRTNQGAFAGDNGPDINVDIRPIKGAYTGISIDGSVFSNTALTQDGIDARVYTPNPATPGTTVEIDYDEFFANSGVLVDLVPAGTAVTVTMTPKTGPAQLYTVHTNAFTTEAISITNLSDSTLAGATLGTPLHVIWTLPTTFAIAEVKLSATVFDGDQTQNTTTSCQVEELILSTDATSGDITLPATVCGSNGATVQANLNLSVTGVNGERDSVIYMFTN
jgi:hypothetical protein